MVNSILNENNSTLNSIPLKSRITREMIPAGSWIYKDDNYTYSTDGIADWTLPAVSKEYEEVLTALGIPYVEGKNSNEGTLIFWNPKYESYNKVTGKLYCYNEDTDDYTLRRKVYSRLLPSATMMEKATELCDIVENEIEDFDKFKKIDYLLFSKVASALFVTYKSHKEGSYSWNFNEIKLFSLYVDNHRRVEVLFNVSKIRERKFTQLNFYLPKQLKPYEAEICGENNSRLKAWAKEIGVKQIVLQ